MMRGFMKDNSNFVKNYGQTYRLLVPSKGRKKSKMEFDREIGPWKMQKGRMK